jgi:hypothetical protein
LGPCKTRIENGDSVLGIWGFSTTGFTNHKATLFKKIESTAGAQRTPSLKKEGLRLSNMSFRLLKFLALIFKNSLCSSRKGHTVRGSAVQ